MGTGIRRTHREAIRTVTTGEGRSPIRRVVSLVTAGLIVLGAVVLPAQAAIAAPNVTYPGAISNVALESTSGGNAPLTQWDAVKMTADWSVPDGAKAGETFGMTLPAEFRRRGPGTFELKHPDTGAVQAKCAIADADGPDMVCTLTDAIEGLEHVGGSLWADLTASQSTTSETVSFDLGNGFTPVDLPGTGGIVPENTVEPTEPYKYGSATAVDGRLRWDIGVPSGYVSNGGFTITDELDRSKENHHYTGVVRLNQRPVENGVYTGDWVLLDASNYTVQFSPDMLSFTFTASGLPASGYGYKLEYITEADGVVLPGDVFGNEAVVNTTKVSSAHTITASGGGEGGGDAYGRFTITKVVTGDEAAAVADQMYSVRYSVKGSADPAVVTKVPVGEPIKSNRAPLGSTFVIEEIDLPVISGVEWGDWTITGDGVVAMPDGTYEVKPGTNVPVELTLTNVANSVLGSLAWTKTDGGGAALAGSEWSLVGPSGELAVIDNGARDENPADGALLVSGLELGEYTLTETKAPEGYELSTTSYTAVIDEGTREATFGAIVNVKTPPPPPVTPPTPPVTPPTPETPPVAPPGGLAATGGSVDPILPLSGALLVVMGLVAAAVGARRKALASSDD